MLDRAEVGPLLETHEHFPDRTNVQIVHVDGPGQVTAADNLPFEAPLDDPRVKALLASTLDAARAAGAPCCFPLSTLAIRRTSS